MLETARNPLSTISNLQLKPFLQKFIIYANYPKCKKTKKGLFQHFYTARRSKTGDDALKIAPEILSILFQYPFQTPPPFSLLTKSYTQILPRYPALLNSTGPIFSVFQAQFDALPKTLSLHTCPKNSQILTGYSCTQFRLSFCSSFDKKKKGGENKASFSH